MWRLISKQCSALANSESLTSSSRSIAGDPLHGIPQDLSIARYGIFPEMGLPRFLHAGLALPCWTSVLLDVPSELVSEGSFMIE